MIQHIALALAPALLPACNDFPSFEPDSGVSPTTSPQPITSTSLDDTNATTSSAVTTTYEVGTVDLDAPGGGEGSCMDGEQFISSSAPIGVIVGGMCPSLGCGSRPPIRPADLPADPLG